MKLDAHVLSFSVCLLLHSDISFNFEIDNRWLQIVLCSHLAEEFCSE